MLGERLPPTFKLVNQVPRSRASTLPKSLPVFRYTRKPCDFSTNGLQELLDQSVFAGTNLTALLHGRSNAAPIRLATDQHLDHFFVDATAGAITYATHDTGINLRVEIPPYDGIPGFDTIRDTVLRYAAVFGVSTNEMEHKADGSLLLRRTDDKTVVRGGAIKFISRRSVGVARGLAGYPLLASDDKIELALGVKGRLLRFHLKWPNIEAASTNRVFTIGQIVDNIRKGCVVADATNQYPPDGVTEIILKDFRVFYYLPETRDFRQTPTNANIVPIASFHVAFRSKSGKTEAGGIFTPLVQP